MNEPPGFAQNGGNVGIVGVGLIGGSIAAALKSRHFPGRILGVGRNAERMQAAKEAGLIDEGLTDLATASAKSQLLIFCTPVDCIAAQVRESARAAKPGTLITDAGSTKSTIVNQLQEGLPAGVTFIGSHPLAGSEKNGFEHADADLYVNRTCVLTPTAQTPPEELRQLTQFWKFLGMKVLELSPEEHDRRLALTSHLPHTIASALAGILDHEAAPLAATGFRDTTRIAAGDPALWVSILFSNADSVLQAISKFSLHLDEFSAALRNRDADKLHQLLTDAKRNRDALEG